MGLKFLNKMRSSPVMQNLSANLCHLTEITGVFPAVPPGEISVAADVWTYLQGVPVFLRHAV